MQNQNIQWDAEELQVLGPAQDNHVNVELVLQHNETDLLEFDQLLDELLRFEQVTQVQGAAWTTEPTQIAGPGTSGHPTPMQNTVRTAAPAQNEASHAFQHWTPNLPRSNNVRTVCYEHGCKGKVFSCAENYRRHVREREVPAPVFCPCCNSKFTRQGNLKIHFKLGRCKPLERALSGA